MAEPDTQGLTVEQALTELCNTFPVEYVEILMRANRNGIAWDIKVGRGYEARLFDASTLESAMNRVRAWKQEQG